MSEVQILRLRYLSVRRFESFDRHVRTRSRSLLRTRNKNFLFQTRPKSFPKFRNFSSRSTVTTTSAKQADFKCNLLGNTYFWEINSTGCRPPLLKNQQKQMHSDHGWQQPGSKRQESVQKPSAAESPEVPRTREKVPEERP